MTNAERQRRWRERRKAAFEAAQALAEPALRNALAPTAQARLEAAIRAHKKLLEAQFDREVQTRIKEVLDETILPSLREQERRAAMIVQSHKGVFSVRDYHRILKCLHPDTVPTSEARGEAFRLFTEKKPALVAEREAPANEFTLPATAAELLARRKTKR